MVVDPRNLDLGRGEADVALRAAQDPGSGPIVIRKLRHLPGAVYCSRDYAARSGCPRATEELPNHKVIGSDGPLAAMAAFQSLERAAGRAQVMARSNSLPNMMTAVRAGLGLAVLPCAMAEPETDLVRCIGPLDEIGAPLWMVTRSDNKDEPRIRAFTSFIAARIVAMRHLFELREPTGEPQPPADRASFLI